MSDSDGALAPSSPMLAPPLITYIVHYFEHNLQILESEISLQRFSRVVHFAPLWYINRECFPAILCGTEVIYAVQSH